MTVRLTAYTDCVAVLFCIVISVSTLQQVIGAWYCTRAIREPVLSDVMTCHTVFHAFTLAVFAVLPDTVLHRMHLNVSQ
jgi:hypothetical protein